MNRFRTIWEYAGRGKAFRRWYVHARLVAARVATETGQTTGRVADVLAITSPRTSVTRNLRVATGYLRGEGLPSDVVRATRAALRHYEATGEIRGPKTSAFAKALRGDNNVCVVDSHMARAFGYRADDARALWVRRPIERRLRRIARMWGWTLAETQAAVWAGYYREAYPTGKVPMYKAP